MTKYTTPALSLCAALCLAASIAHRSPALACIGALALTVAVLAAALERGE